MAKHTKREDKADSRSRSIRKSILALVLILLVYELARCSWSSSSDSDNSNANTDNNETVEEQVSNTGNGDADATASENQNDSQGAEDSQATDSQDTNETTEQEENHEGQVQAPVSSSDAKRENYSDVVGSFERAGFTNVSTEEIKDLYFGWLTTDGSVEDVSIDGSTDYGTDDWFQPDVGVVIRYHTFYERNETSESSGGTESSTSGGESAGSAGSDVTDTSTLTADNNADLAALLQLRDPEDASVATFAERYAGRTIEFDGCITNLQHHGNYRTRYDYLIGAGDYSAETQRGPNFQFSDVGSYDMHWTGETPDYVGRGQNLHIVATVGKYDPNTGLFQLTPVSTSVR